jgi:hypothetical protein
VNASHVVDRVVDQDGVEHPAQPDRAHVPLLVRALGVEPLRDGQHPGGQVDQGQVQAVLQVHRDVAAATAEIEHLADLDGRGGEQPGQVGGLRRVLPRR